MKSSTSPNPASPSIPLARVISTFLGLLAVLAATTNPPPAAAQLPSEVTGPFEGITLGDEQPEGLFPLRTTGVSTAPVVEAARSYLSALDAEQREGVTFPLESDEWRHWANFPQLDRRGVALRDMSEDQRNAALALVRAGLSAEGFQQAQDVMEVSGYVQELMDDPSIYGEHLYFINVMGEPSATEPWGWQLDGYHLVVNYFVLGDQVVMTPQFWGIEPAVIESGPLAGTAMLQEEQDDGLALMRSLSPEQQATARIRDGEKTGNVSMAAAFADNQELDYVGLRADAMNAEQRELLLAIVENYLGNLKEGHARLKMEQVREHLDETWFAWIGGSGPDDVFYYTVRSPVVLLEFDHTIPVVLDPGDPRRPSKQHIHSVIRTPNGNDYGKDLLRQHYEETADDPNHDHGGG